MKETYLGDGVYEGYDGFYIWLRTEREGRQERIALEPAMLQELYNRYLKPRMGNGR